MLSSGDYENLKLGKRVTVNRILKVQIFKGED